MDQEAAPVEETPSASSGMEETSSAQALSMSEEPEKLLEALRRVQADFVNYKRRTEEGRLEQQRQSASKLIIKLLPILDEFVLAIDHASKDGSEPSWLEGIALIQRKLNGLLESENVTKIEAQGKEFDPFEHEALAYQESSKHPEGHVLSVVRDGYRMDERVLRPALVILAQSHKQQL